MGGNDGRNPANARCWGIVGWKGKLFFSRGAEDAYVRLSAVGKTSHATSSFKDTHSQFDIWGAVTHHQSSPPGDASTNAGTCTSWPEREMGVPRLRRHLQPYADRATLDVGKAVIDGPALAYHIHSLCSTNAASVPSCRTLASVCLRWLDELTRHGLSMQVQIRCLTPP